MRGFGRRAVALTAATLVLLGGCAEAAPQVGSVAASQSRSDQRCQRLSGAARWEGVDRVSATTATLDEHDDYFTPTCLEVPWNTPVTLVVTNFGHMPHTVTVRRTPVDTDVDSGATVFVKIPATTVPLHVVCTFHIDQRMFAEVIPVKGPRT